MNTTKELTLRKGETVAEWAQRMAPTLTWPEWEIRFDHVKQGITDAGFGAEMEVALFAELSRLHGQLSEAELYRLGGLQGDEGCFWKHAIEAHELFVSLGLAEKRNAYCFITPLGLAVLEWEKTQDEDRLQRLADKAVEFESQPDAQDILIGPKGKHYEIKHGKVLLTNKPKTWNDVLEEARKRATGLLMEFREPQAVSIYEDGQKIAEVTGSVAFETVYSSTWDE